MQPTPHDQRDDVGAPTRDEGSSAAPNTVASMVPDLAVLDGLDERPPHEHAAVYERVHAQLQNALSEIDDA